MNIRPRAVITATLMLSTAAPGLLTSTQAAEYSPALSWNCSGCHGTNGVSTGGAVPSIAGMNERYFFTIMRGFKLDERYSTIMGRIAKGYRIKEIRTMAQFFGAQEWIAADTESREEQISGGEVIHDELCAECHENGGRYQDKEIPRLAGQQPAYLELQMYDYQAADQRVPQPDKMRERMAKLTDEDIEDLSAFYAHVDGDYEANPPREDKGQ